MVASILSAQAMFYDEQDDQKYYIPKSQRSRFGRLKAQWSLVLKSWLKKGFDKVEEKVFNWRTRHKYYRIHGIAMRHSAYKSTRVIRFLAFQAVAMSATGQAVMNNPVFDTDSGMVGIDNRCSACISNKIEDFIDIPIDSNRVIKGFGGARTSNVKTGTILWKWEDDNGMVHEQKIPKSYYVPHGGVRLLSPQHWMQVTMSKQEKMTHSSSCLTFHDHVILKWKKFALTVPLDSESNVASFNLAPGYSRFQAFCAEAGTEDQMEHISPVCMEARPFGPEPIRFSEEEAPFLLKEPLKEDFNLDGPSAFQDEEESDEIDDQATGDSAELLRFHQKYAHISMKKLQALATRGILPRKLAKCPVPV
jgi:hypothetical protein